MRSVTFNALFKKQSLKDVANQKGHCSPEEYEARMNFTERVVELYKYVSRLYRNGRGAKVSDGGKYIITTK